MTWWNMPRRAWVIILAELAVIIFFASGFYSEYLNNSYFHDYLNSLAPILIPVLSVAFGVCSATIATFLYFGTKRITQTQDTIGTPVKKRSQTRKVPRRTNAGSEQKPVKTTDETLRGVPRPRFIITNPTSSNQPSEAGAQKKESK